MPASKDDHIQQFVQPIYDFGPFRLFVSERRLERAGVVVPLGGRALDLLITLVNRAGEVVDKIEIMNSVWPKIHVEQVNLRYITSMLKLALGDSRDQPVYIKNVRGRGYCFIAPVNKVTIGHPEARSLTFPLKGSLPSRLERMVGRDSAVQEVCAHVAEHRCVTIVGAGGIGKTTLALAVAWDWRDQSGDSVCFIDVAHLVDTELIPAVLVTILGFKPEGDPLLSLIAFFNDRRFLLILDGCEHSISATAVFAEQILRDTETVSILATSREPIQAEGERVHRLLPLAFPSELANLTAEAALEFPAVQLLVERTGAAQNGFQLADEEAYTAAEICRRLDGMALAIELAASRVGTIGLKETAVLLDSHLSLHWLGRPTATPRHQTLSATLDWSYTVLADRDGLVFRRLAVFVGYFTMGMAKSILSDDRVDEYQIADALANLVAKSLVAADRVGTNPRFRLLDTTRSYAAEKLAASGETDVMARRHAMSLASMLEYHQTSDVPAIDDSLLAMHREYSGNVRAALKWCFSKSGDLNTGVILSACIAPALIELSLWSDCKYWCQHALNTGRCGIGSSLQLLEILTCYVQALLLLDENPEELRSLIEEAIRSSYSLSSPYTEIRALNCFHRFLSRNEDYLESLNIAQRIMELAQSIGSIDALAIANFSLSISHHFIGNQGKSILYYRDAAKLMPASRCFECTLFGFYSDFHALICHSRSLWLSGFPVLAAAAAHETLTIAEGKKRQGALSLHAIWVIFVFFWIQEWESANSVVDSLLDLTKSHPLTPIKELGLALRGELLTRQGDLNQGIPLLRNYVDIIQAAGRYNTMASLALVEGLMANSDLQGASVYLEAVVLATRKCNHLLDLPEMIRLRGEIQSRQGFKTEAAACFLKAVSISKTQSAQSWELRAQLSLARLTIGEAGGQNAFGSLRSLFDGFTEGFDTPDLVAVREFIAGHPGNGAEISFDGVS